MLLVSSFISPFSFLRYLDFFPDFFSQVGKRLHKKAKINFRIDDIIKWYTNNYDTPIAQFFKK